MTRRVDLVTVPDLEITVGTAFFQTHTEGIFRDLSLDFIRQISNPGGKCPVFSELPDLDSGFGLQRFCALTHSGGRSEAMVKEPDR